MGRKLKAKWHIIGLVPGCAAIVVSVIVIIARINRTERFGPSPFGEVQPDIGESLHELGRPAIWNATHMPLGQTGFKAAAGPNRYTDEPGQDWDHYSIDVERPAGRSSHVYFSRDFRMNEIPADIIDKNVRDIVTFDEETRIVTFDLGTRTETYTLPNR